MLAGASASDSDMSRYKILDPNGVTLADEPLLAAWMLICARPWFWYGLTKMNPKE